NGGYLYGELESRVPGQLILPGRWRHIDKRIETGSGADSRYSKYAMAGHVTIGDGQTYERASFFVANNIASSGYSWYERDQWFWIYCRAAQGTQINWKVQAASSGDSFSTTTGSTVEDANGFYWHGIKVITDDLPVL